MSLPADHMKPDSFHHLPVLPEAVVNALEPVLGPGRVAVDCTLGGGGHAGAMLETGARVIGIDRDQSALDAVRALIGGQSRLELVHGDFRDLQRIAGEQGLGVVNAILADLGVSSPQLDEPSRGFSFRRAGPLDMRMDISHGEPLIDKLRSIGEKDLARVIRDFGEERRANQVARAILRALIEGRLTDTAALADCVASAVGGRGGRERGHIHPATRTFQALRIWVNDELGALDALLEAIPRLLAPGGRAAIISFHSLEDRRVKQAFAALCRGCVCPRQMPVCACGRRAEFTLVSRRAIRASEFEADANPRARSARMRVIERLVDGKPASNEDQEVDHD